MLEQQEWICLDVILKKNLNLYDWSRAYFYSIVAVDKSHKK